jgi:ribose 5-phosphate isomerase RpiB
MRIGIATDHGGFGLKEDLRVRLAAAGDEVVEFGAFTLVTTIRTLLSRWRGLLRRAR